MIYILLSVRDYVTAFVATIGTTERDMGLSILPVAHQYYLSLIHI